MRASIKLACLGTSTWLGVTAFRGFHHASASTNRVYTSVRHEWELNQLLSLPNPLLVNFCIYTDPQSSKVSKALKNVVTKNEDLGPLSCVDVEVDEPDTQNLIQRFLVSSIPTIVQINGGERVKALIPREHDVPSLEAEIRHWYSDKKFMWPFSKESSAPKVINAGDRKKCWAARDTFFQCLDAHSIIDATKNDSKARKACPQEIKDFEEACVDVWADYFKQKRVADYTKEMRIKELEKAGYQPLNTPLQVKSITEEEARAAK